MFTQKDTFKENYSTYIQSNNKATKIDYSILPQPKPQKDAINLILNQRTASLKNAPIQNSDKKQPPVIKPYTQFKGSKPLPTFKRDLKSWGIVC